MLSKEQLCRLRDALLDVWCELSERATLGRPSPDDPLFELYVKVDEMIDEGGE